MHVNGSSHWSTAKDTTYAGPDLSIVIGQFAGFGVYTFIRLSGGLCGLKSEQARFAQQATAPAFWRRQSSEKFVIRDWLKGDMSFSAGMIAWEGGSL
jgi:hypothetical protein